MTSMPPTQILVRPGHSEEIDRIGVVLADAFRDDPVFEWVLGPSPTSDAARTRFFTGWTAKQFSEQRRTRVAERDGILEAAALWTDPPGAQPSPRGALLRGLWPLRELTGLRRFPRFVRLVMATEARYPRFPHYYLGAIGAAASARGSGIGSALIRATLDECDHAGLPAYLESSNPRNLTFYWRHGFRVLEELRLGRNAPSLTLMIREPGGR